MNRRAVLRGAGGAGTVLLAGCTGASTGTDDPAETPTDAETGTTSEDPYRVVERSFEVVSNECGTTDESVTGSIDPPPPAPDASEHTVTVTGTITGSDTCHTARLAGLTRGEDGGTMEVAVETYVPKENADSVCGECIVAVEYELTVTTAGGRPDEVVVSHDGERAGRVDLPE